VVLRILVERPSQEMVSDIHATLVAEETGLSVSTIRKLRSQIGPKGTGLIRFWRERPDDKTSPFWVGLTAAGLAVAEGRDLRDPSSPPPTSSLYLENQEVSEKEKESENRIRTSAETKKSGGKWKLNPTDPTGDAEWEKRWHEGREKG
jgi:hypothetical protein